MNCGLRIETGVFNPQSPTRNPQSIMKPLILIIEDDPDIAESIRYNLEREGSFAAKVALTGEEGLNIALDKAPIKHPGRTGELNNSTPDLIVLDLNLPGMSGFELCRRFRTEEDSRR